MWRYAYTYITYFWLITVTWILECLDIVAQQDPKSDNDHDLNDIRYGRTLRDDHSLILTFWQSDIKNKFLRIRTNFWDRDRDDRETFDLVCVSVEFHQPNAISFKWSDQFSKIHNRWEYDLLLKLSAEVHHRHSSWSVLLVPSLLVVSLSLGRSAIQYSMRLTFIYNVRFSWKSHRVHYVTFLPTLIITIFFHSVPTRLSSTISSRSMTSINAMSFLRTRL